MMQKTLVTLSFLVVLILQPILCPAPAFMKLGDIKGESQDKDHKDWIILTSVSQSLHKPGGGASSAVFDDIQVSKQLDKSSPKLAEAVAKGTYFPEATIVLTSLIGNDQRPYLVYKLEQVLITNYSLHAETPEALPQRDGQTEQLSLNYEEIKFSYGGIRKTVIRYDDNGIETERITMGVPTRVGGTVPPEDEVLPPQAAFDGLSISQFEEATTDQHALEKTG